MTIFLQQLLFDALLIIIGYYLHILSEILSSTQDLLLSLSFKKIADTMLYLVQIVLYSIFFIILSRLWISRSDEELIVLPFEVSSDNEKSKEKYEGNLISNILVSEINWIKSINQSKYATIYYRKPDAYTPLSNMSYEVRGINYTVPAVISHDNFEITPSVGSMTMGGLTFSMQEILLYLKRLLCRNSIRYISGSFQVTDSNCHIIALMQGYRTNSWDIDACLKNNEDFKELMKNLAYQIYYDLLSDKNQQSGLKNCKCLRYFTEALYNYQLYTNTKQITYLNIVEEKIDLMKKEGATECSLIYGLLYNLGYAYINENRYKKAKELFLSAYNLGINTGGGSLLAITECLRHLDKDSQLDNFCRKAIDKSEQKLKEEPDDIFELLIKAYSHYCIYEFEKALCIYENLVKENKNELYILPYINCWLSKCYYILDKEKKVIKILEDISNKFPENFRLRFQNSTIFINMVEYDKLVDCCNEKLAKINRNIPYPYIYCWLSNCYYILDKKRKALKIIEEATKRFPQDSYVWSQRAMIFFNMQNNKDSLDCCKKALKFDPNNYEAWTYVNGG